MPPLAPEELRSFLRATYGSDTIPMAADGTARVDRLPNLRRMAYWIARRKGFPALAPCAAGEPAWRQFCQHANYNVVAEASLLLDDVEVPAAATDTKQMGFITNRRSPIEKAGGPKAGMR